LTQSTARVLVHKRNITTLLSLETQNRHRPIAARQLSRSYPPCFDRTDPDAIEQSDSYTDKEVKGHIQSAVDDLNLPNA